MALDLKKRIRLRTNKEEVKYVMTLSCIGKYKIVTIRTKPECGEFVWVVGEQDLENIPESRWLNVYANIIEGVSPKWAPSRATADTGAQFGRIAVIEDKQDGSDWIIHKVGN